MKKKWQIFLIISVLSTGLAESQEIVTGLLSNIQLSDASLSLRLKSAKGSDTLTLPFIDDFSYESPYPSAAFWDDKMAFINNTYSINQITQGVATFDCLNKSGKLYDEASTGTFSADSLTSVALDLNYNPGDSIYLSFLYEAGGIADIPETSDSLTLHFWSPSEGRWFNVWHAEGEATNGFKRVMIPVISPRFLEKGFRFRFVNYASLSGVGTEPSKAGNADQWNIDYVKLAAGRNANDTVLRDAAITLPFRSLVKKYEAMPWRQFRQAYLTAMSSTAKLDYRNNDTILYNIYRYIKITDVYNNSVVKFIDAGAEYNIPPLTDVSSDILLNYTYNSVSVDSALFLVTSYLETNSNDSVFNDTIRYYQRFKDYFAIDDGTSEAGYGINGQGSRNAMAAIKFRAYLPDSVAAISFCFNDAINNANQRAFDIMVWADDNGKPGTLLGTTEGPVAAPGTKNNGFVTYFFDTPVRVTGNFWVGWRQLSETFLNTGLDLNTAPEDRQYYSISNSWQLSQAPGTIMMRAVMTGPGTSTSSGNDNLFNDMFRLYPNPASDYITLEASDSAPPDFTIEIYNSSGTRIMSMPRTENPDISNLIAGYYIILIRSKNGTPVSLLRLIKSK